MWILSMEGWSCEEYGLGVLILDDWNYMEVEFV